MSSCFSRSCCFILFLALVTGGLALSSQASAKAVQPAHKSHTQAPASVRGEDVIAAIRVEGAQRIEPETIIARLTVAKGDRATPQDLDASLKALYATGLFENVALKMDGATLVVNVAENPIINRVTFEGNDAISTEDLEKEVQLKPRQVYTLPKVQHDVQRLLDVYRRSGRFSAVVEPKIVKLEQNRVDLVFEITEGKRTGIRSITFIGNTHFDSDDLREVISSRESAWWRFFSSSDYYDPDRMNYDKELLRKFYLSEGYVDFKVLSAVAELTPDRDDFFMTFTVEEGQRYKFGKINVQSEIKGVNADALRKYLTTQQGDWYDAEQIDKTIAKLTTVLGDMQYAFVTIIPEPTRHADSRTVDLTYTIKQGERVYIGRVNISGNTRTIDKVIRREIQVAEGDPFSATKVQKSEQRLKDLGFFDQAKVTPVDGAQPDRADLDVKVKEKSTGEIMLGAGYSSTDGPLGDFSIHERNFMGKGQDVRLGATISGRTKQVDTSFTEPYFMDRDLSTGVDLFLTQTDNQDLSSYNTNSAGFALRAGYPLSEELRQRLTYTLHADDITSVPSTASVYIQNQAGQTMTSSFGQELTWDTRDSKLDPTLGFITHLDTDIAGAGGSRKYVRVKAGGTQYYPLAEHWVMSGTVEGGEIWGLDGPTKINERFFLGGDTLRGFQYAGMGPRDITNSSRDALGGTRFARGTVELSTPTPLPPDLGLKGHVFVDAGVLDKSGDQAIAGNTIADDGSLRMSAGVGLSWASPFGPLRLDFAEPILSKSYDKKEFIHFSFGTKF